MTQPAAPVGSRTSMTGPPCAARPDSWDLEVGTPETWRQAVRTCHECPFFADCAKLANKLTRAGQGPRAMIWAGVAYDCAGRVIGNLDHYHPPGKQNRVTKIVHIPSQVSRTKTTSADVRAVEHRRPVIVLSTARGTTKVDR